MNSIALKKETINEILKEDYKYLQTIYPHDQIFGVFVYGKACYGFAEKVEDVEVKMYYLPTLEEMCTNVLFKDEILEYNNHKINIKDIRLIFDNVLTQEGTAMECFFSDYYIITPKFKKVYMDVILSTREDIFRHSPKIRVEHSVNMAFESLNKYMNTTDPEYLWDACRRRIGTQMYVAGIPVEECIKLKKDYHITYLWSVKRGLSMPDMDDVINDLRALKERAKTLPEHPELSDMIKQTIVDIMQISLTKTISANDFLKMLTNTEKQALKYVMNYITDGEGVVSISKLVAESGLSRPVFKSLLDKTKEMEIAEITNMGVKGTAIKIIDGVFLNIDDFID